MEIPENLPVLPVRDIVVFPYMILPLFVGREMSIKAIEYSLSTNKMVLLLTQKDLDVESPSPEDLYSIGTVGIVMRMLKLPDGRVKFLVRGLNKARALNYSQTVAATDRRYRLAVRREQAGAAAPPKAKGVAGAAAR